MTTEDAQKLEQYVCIQCSFVDEMKKSQAIVALSPKTDGEVMLLISNLQLFNKDT